MSKKILSRVDELFSREPELLLDFALKNPEEWALIDKIVSLKFSITSAIVLNQERILMGEDNFRDYWRSISKEVVFDDTRPVKEKINEFKNTIKLYEFRFYSNRKPT